MFCNWKKLDKETRAFIAKKKIMMGVAGIIIGLIWLNYPSWMPYVAMLAGLVFVAKGIYLKSKQ
ncbi:hypothetical protein HZB89_00560 [archaeon]|nr:hypothetical protein [archaeon]